METKTLPWWLFSLRLPVSDTTIRETGSAERKCFVIEGRPALKSLHWVVQSPLLAVLSMAALGALAWALEIKTGSGQIKFAFICLLGLIPTLVWGISGLVLGIAIRPRLNRQAELETRRVEISLDLGQNLLSAANASFPFAQICDFYLLSDSGRRYQPEQADTALFNLMVETSGGEQTRLLPKDLGNTRQKLELIGRLKALTGKSS